MTGLRVWQQEVSAEWNTRTSDNFLIVATPGAGKTAAALHIVANEREITRVIVVVPTDHLKRQWKRAAAAAGIAIEPWDNQPYEIPSDLDGLVVTYQQVASNPELHRAITSRKRTLAIFDEIHHAGDQASWGKALLYAYEPARARLMLSGTPFRTDGTRIPFVPYKPSGECDPQYQYLYARALSEGICRPLSFQTFEGHLQWLDSSGNQQEASFADELSDADSRRRLALALNPDVEWIRNVLREADAQLTLLRQEETPDAGGLVIAYDTNHAEALAALLGEFTREPIAIATSDIPDASDAIERFRIGKGKWLVAVRMVSEGVDIPRLRLGVYATRVSTPIFFQQVCGRFVRRQPQSEAAMGYIFLPKDPELCRHARDIEAAVANYYNTLLEPEIEREPREHDPSDPPSPWTPLQAIAFKDDVIVHGKTIPAEERRRVEALVAQLPAHLRVSPEAAAFLLRLAGQSLPSITPVSQAPPDPRGELHTLAGALTRQLARMTSRRHEDINIDLARRTGARIRESSLPQLQERVRLLKAWIQQANGG